MFHNISYANRGGPRNAPRSRSPKPRHQPPRHAARIIGIAIQLALQHTIFVEDAIKKERQYGGDQESAREPRSERDTAGDHDQYPGTVTGVAHHGVWSAVDDVLPAV